MEFVARALKFFLLNYVFESWQSPSSFFPILITLQGSGDFLSMKRSHFLGHDSIVAIFSCLEGYQQQIRAR